MTAGDGIILARETGVGAIEFQTLLKSSGLDAIRPAENLDRLQRMLDNANLVVTARLPEQGNRLVGVARAATDFSWFCYLSDLAVAQDMKGRGVGRGLLAHVRLLLGPEVSLILASVPDATGFYEQAGMQRMKDCFFNRRES